MKKPVNIISLRLAFKILKSAIKALKRFSHCTVKLKYSRYIKRLKSMAVKSPFVIDVIYEGLLKEFTAISATIFCLV